MNANEMMWRVLANGQRVMGAELIQMAKGARSVEEVRECVDLANKCALIETSCLERAGMEAEKNCKKCGRPLVAMQRADRSGSTSWLACVVC